MMMLRIGLGHDLTRRLCQAPSKIPSLALVISFGIGTIGEQAHVNLKSDMLLYTHPDPSCSLYITTNELLYIVDKVHTVRHCSSTYMTAQGRAQQPR